MRTCAIILSLAAAAVCGQLYDEREMSTPRIRGYCAHAHLIDTAQLAPDLQLAIHNQTNFQYRSQA